ncbi:MAG: 23S rRNA (adenine(2503)-C(2))-methyltransferase RlmN [Succinivibrio sp.]|nr:23S rRNA (adenine(2503)-C(2))-methyltransferase RlmN [Succinivibrio sp.]
MNHLENIPDQIGTQPDTGEAQTVPSPAGAGARLNLLGLSPEQLTEFVLGIGEKKFRAQQLMRWIYQFGVCDFADMTDIRKELRAGLAERCEIRAPEIVSEQRSQDGTIKWAFDVGQGQLVEAVLIPEDDRNTLCISTQVGCPVGCAFCRTGAGGFSRNLSAGEIIGQVWRASQIMGFSHNEEHKPISNVVMMGMGEPLLNLNGVLPALELLLNDYAFALSKRRVTISTAGIAPAIRKIAGQVDVALALSLHAADDELRNTLVPCNRKFNLQQVLEAVRYYVARSNANCGRVTIEYVLIDRVNDSLEQAQQLCELLSDLPCKINLIPFNSHECSGYHAPSGNRVERFFRYLAERGFTVMKRSTRGEDIAAACGQLAGQVRARRAAAAHNSG